MIKKVTKKLPKLDSLEKYPKYIPENVDTLEEGIQLKEGERVDVLVQISKNLNGGLAFECNELPHCCGIYELGDIYCKDLMPEHINYILDYSLATTKKTVIINTNGKAGCIPMEKALAVSKSFTLVKTFKNTTGNTIKMWISNN